MRGVRTAVTVVAIVAGAAAIWLATRPQDQPAVTPPLEPPAQAGSLDASPSPISESHPVRRVTPRSFVETAEMR